MLITILTFSSTQLIHLFHCMGSQDLLLWIHIKISGLPTQAIATDNLLLIPLTTALTSYWLHPVD